jgi:ATP-dependent DNA helicase RecG
MLEELLNQQESKTLEFKENTSSLTSIIKTVVAFANTAGGTLVIGVQDRTKKIVGVKNSLDEEERLTSAIADSISPFMVPDIDIQSYKEKELIIIRVPHLAGPFYVKKDGIERGAYIRLGSTNRAADAQKLAILRLYTKNISFDELACQKMTYHDLDWQTIKEVFAQAQKKITDVKAENLGMLVSHAGKLSPSNGGIILFGSNRTDLFPDAIIRCARFLGSTKAEILDHLDIDAYPTHAIEQALHFIRRNTTMSAKFGRIQREDIPEYPVTAIRESIVNALLHTDYSFAGASIKIAIFDNRIEITSPGGLPLGMTLERALAGASQVRNRVLARVFRELNIIEQWGSGLQRIIDSCLKHNLEHPIFEEFDDMEFKVTLYNAQHATKKQTTSRTSFDAPQKEFVNHLKKHKKISTKEAAELWDIAPRNARIRLKNLAAAGIIKRVGTSAQDPKGVYVLVSSPDKRRRA